MQYVAHIALARRQVRSYGMMRLSGADKKQLHEECSHLHSKKYKREISASVMVASVCLKHDSVAFLGYAA